MKRYIYLYFITLIASFGGLLAGYDTGVISGALLYIGDSFKINASLQGLIVSSVSFGAVLGAIINGFLIDKIGRKKTLLIVGVIFILSSLFCFLSQNVYELILSRILTGVAVGVVSFAGPLYLSEISTKEKRGQIVSFHQLAITLGILFSYLINSICANFVLNWRLMLLFGAVPAIVLVVGMIFQNDTPRWLVQKGYIDKAKEVLKKIDNSAQVDEEIKNIQSTLVERHEKISKKLLLPFVIGIGIMFCQIATGINAIIYYAPTLFKMLGFQSNHDALVATIFIGIINFLMTFVAIAFVDKIGRKPLLYIGLSGMLISLVVLSSAFILDYSFIKYLAVAFCAIYIVSFSMSIGPVGLLLISEVFPLRYRGQAMSISIVANFVFNFIVTGLFPISIEKLGGAITFLIFALICVISLLFIYFVVPETKNISLEDIEKKLFTL